MARFNTSRRRAAVSPEPNSSLAVWLGGLGICLLFVALRWNNYDLPLIRDEGEYTYAAGLLKRGLPPYANAFLQKPPMIVYTYALASSLLPHTFWAARLLGYFFVAATTGLLGWIGRREFGSGIALTAMGLFTPMVLLPEIDQFMANTEFFLLLPLLATAAGYVLARGRGAALGCWFGAGFFAALTFWYKYTVLPLLLAVWAIWSVREWLRRGKSQWPWRGWLAWLLGGLLATALTLGFFAIRGGLKELWNCTILFNRFYAFSRGNFGWSQMFDRLFELLTLWWILFLLPTALPTSRDRRLLAWGGMLAAALVATSRSYYPQYYILLMPFWALLGAVAIRQLAGVIAAKFSWPVGWVRRPLALVVIGLVLLPDLDWITYSKRDFYNFKMNTTNPFRESRLVAEKIDELTTTNDTIYVAGSEPQIYCYAGRMSATRFVIAYPFMIPTPLAEAYQRETMVDLERHPPAVIVFARAEESWLMQPGTPPWFMDYLQKLMREKYEILGGAMQTPNDYIWQQPLSAEETAKASLVLLRRKPMN